MKKDELTAIENKTREMEALLKEVQDDSKKLKKFIKLARGARKRMKKLSKYYHTDWLDDRDTLAESSEKDFTILGEDTIYDEMVNQYDIMRKVLRESAIYISEK